MKYIRTRPYRSVKPMADAIKMIFMSGVIFYCDDRSPAEQDPLVWVYLKPAPRPGPAFPVDEKCVSCLPRKGRRWRLILWRYRRWCSLWFVSNDQVVFHHKGLLSVSGR